MTDERPNPDDLLSRVEREEHKVQRGKLKVFFGSNAGVGKTYAMLDEARMRAAEGANVLIGYAEPHIRPDTEALLLGLDLLPYKLVEHKGSVLKEFDLDGALARHPAICCVDELAHTNAPGLRHPKRWQDVFEMLEAGISVYTTLNVQHLESVNDIVEKITGIRVRETLPDRVLEEADEVELVDISPDELVERLREGKVYKPEQVEQALKHFFNRGNLIALRELALRKTAERVDVQMLEARHAAAPAKTWAASERILVCVGPSPFAGQIVRAAKRLAVAFRAPWYAVCVEIAGRVVEGAAESLQARTAETLRLAEQLGATPVTLTGTRVADEILAFARQKNITKIVVGKPEMPRWREWLAGSIVDELIRHSGAIDVHVIRHERQRERPAPQQEEAPRPAWQPYGWAAGICLAAALLGVLAYHVFGESGKRLSNTNVLMIHLLAVLFIATRFGRGPAVLASVLAVAAFDFTAVPPYFSFAVGDSQYLFTFAAMLATALVISTLADRLRRQAQAARDREQRTAALLSLSRQLAATRGKQEIVRSVVQQVAEVMGCPVVVFLPNAKGELTLAGISREDTPMEDKERGVVQWVFDHAQSAGRGTDTLPAAAGLYLPMVATGRTVGVLGLLSPSAAYDAQRSRLLEAFANQSALAVERTALAEESRQAWERVEAEFLRNTLLSGVSHDLRTPLAAITGAASSLAETEGLSEAVQRDLARDIVAESERMERLINNLLDMTRLESGGFTLRKEWHPLPEIVGAALAHLRHRLVEHPVKTRWPADLPLIHVDAIALDQVLVNLLDNAALYTPAGTALDIAARAGEGHLVLEVGDRGPGLPRDDPNRVFQKFFRGGQRAGQAADDGSRRGVGLGLAICKGIVELHQGTITAENRPEGGALFRITLPVGGTPPTVPAEPESANTL
jgi:two-component system, OmpR family, sensor histidine kinase KdpD